MDGRCSQCGQPKRYCAECDDEVIFVPKSGFGQTGEWRHLAPPRNDVGQHMARPKPLLHVWDADGKKVSP